MTLTKKILPLAALLAVALPGGTAFAKGPKPKLQFSQGAYAVAENAGSATITVLRPGKNPKRLSQNASVDYTTSNGTAVAGTDYAATHGTVSFGPGETQKTFTVTVYNKDSVDTGARTVNLRLSHPTGDNGGQLGYPSSATLVIADDDTTAGVGPQFQVATAGDIAAEPTGANTAENVLVIRSGDMSTSATINFATAAGSAVSGTDYNDTSGTLTFPDWNTDHTTSIIQSVPVTLLHNPATSPATRDFAFNLSVPSGSSSTLASPSSETVTIVNGDGTPTLQFSAPSYSVAENGGSARLTVFASGNLGSEVDVDYATADGSALAGVNYSSAADTLAFVPGDGDVVQSFDIPVMADGLAGDKAFTAALSNATGGGVIGDPGTATVNVLNTDAVAGDGGNGGNGGNGTPSTDGAPQGGGSQEVLGARQSACGLTIKASKKQKLLKSKVLKLTLRSAQACKVSLGTTIKQAKSKKAARSAKALVFKGKKASLSLQPNKATTVKVKFTKKTLKAIKKALLAHKKLVATVVVTTKDSASKSTRKTLKITIKR